VLNAEDPVAAYQEAEKSGQMRIDGKTLEAKMKIAAALSFGSVIKPFLGSLRSRVYNTTN
jgi:hypothetical protein